MPTITIDVTYDGYSRKENGIYTKLDGSGELWIGLYSGKDYAYKCRTFLRFPLTNLPSGENVTKVRSKVDVNKAGGSNHRTDFHAYNINGQADPQLDNAETSYNRCASGNLYVNDSTELRTTGEKWITLGDGESAQVCIDVEAAKAAVNRFSLGLHEEGDDDVYAGLWALESNYPNAQLEITYGEAPPPSAALPYTDGFVQAGILGLMRNAILSVCGKIQVAG